MDRFLFKAIPYFIMAVFLLAIASGIYSLVQIGLVGSCGSSL